MERELVGEAGVVDADELAAEEVQQRGPFPDVGLSVLVEVGRGSRLGPAELLLVFAGVVAAGPLEELGPGDGPVLLGVERLEPFDAAELGFAADEAAEARGPDVHGDVVEDERR